MKKVNYLKALVGAASVVLACSAFAQASNTGAAATAAPASAAKAAKHANRQLGRQVRAALAKAQGVDVSNISVRARGGAVTLTGTVPDQGQIDKAGATAQGVAGVTSVANKLTVMQQ
jgi:hyperosmotically inducible protein